MARVVSRVGNRRGFVQRDLRDAWTPCTRYQSRSTNFGRAHGVALRTDRDEPRDFMLRSDWVWFGAFTWAASMTHYFGLVAVGVNGLFLLAAATTTERRRIKPLLATLGLAALGLAVADVAPAPKPSLVVITGNRQENAWSRLSTVIAVPKHRFPRQIASGRNYYRRCGSSLSNAVRSW